MTATVLGSKILFSGLMMMIFDSYGLFNSISGLISISIIMPFMLFAMMLFINKPDYVREVHRPPDILFYKKWILNFLSPMEKYIACLSQKYDMNPLSYIVVGITRTLNLVFRVRVFFMAL